MVYSVVMSKHRRMTVPNPPDPAPDSPAGLLATVFRSTDYGERVAALRALRERLDEQEAQLVVEARSGRMTWDEIGAAWGITRQAAWNRWGT